MGLSRPRRWLSISLFLTLELGFISLAAYCTSRPLVLPSSFTPQAQTEVKGAFTILFIVWQSLALFPVRSIVTYVFSSEWTYLFAETGTLVPGRTDRVSTLISGVLDRLRHTYDRKASWSFRTAFLTSLIFLALAAFAPGTISLVIILVPRPMTLNIGNLTMASGDVFEFHHDTWNAIQRAWVMTQLEKIEGSQYGYRNPNNWLVGWPPLGLPVNGSGAIEYPSDVVKFGFGCQWEAPTYDAGASTYVTKDGNWSVWDYLGAAQPPVVSACERSLLHISLVVSFNTIASLAILPMARTKPNDGLSAYLFQGGNSTFGSSGPQTTSYVDLTGLPSVFNLTGDVPQNPHADGAQLTPPLTTVLVCDPQTSISGGKVKLDANGMLAVTSSGLPVTINNIPTEMANTVFTQGLLVSTSAADPHDVSHISVNNIAGGLFLKDPTLNFTLYPNGIPVLDLDNIQSNLDLCISIASKAYMDGYYPKDGFLLGAAPVTVPVDAQGQEQRLALLTSIPILVVIMVCTIISGLLLGLLGMWVEGEGGEPLELGSMLRAVQMNRGLYEGISNST
jgi:hypothetical protein